MTEKKLLPWDLALIGKDGYIKKTYIAPSTVQGAGLGRLAGEMIFEGELVKKEEEIDVDSPLLFSPGKIIKIPTVMDLNKLIKRYRSVSSLSLKDLEYQLSCFIAGSESCLYIHSSSSYANHRAKKKMLSCKITNETRYYYATKDIQKGEEIVSDYGTYFFPNFFVNWCKENGLLTLAQQALLFSKKST